ncbi:AAA family ATPase [Pseudomonas sp. YH-1]|uniref:AAA family ATPase n=1 Tax=Pseudomonas sp. YH-1 TaxID=3384787 RepID=UPI003F7F56FD
MAIQDEIREWLLNQPDWLQEATERLLNKGELGADDLAALVALIKTPAGQKPTKHRQFDALLKAPNATDTLRLVRIGEISGIENLEPRSPLEFESANLTVIYGHNGSGKSSYTRILKKVTGKPRALELKPNVFKAPPQESKCQITSLQNGVESSSTWRVGDAPIDILMAVDIFDSDEASHYLTAESAATYIPPMVGLFEKLASVTEQVRELLSAEQSKLISTLPALPAVYQGTETSRTYSTLGTLKAAALDSALLWKAEDEQRLVDLTERLKADDPSGLAAQKRRTKAQVQQTVNALNQASILYGANNVQTLRNLRAEAHEKRQIAIEGAQVKSAVLDGIGTPTWRAMWEAAREYSSTPYPEKPYPVTEEARCLLCHQELTAEAQQRLKDFETFVHSKLESDAETAEALYSQNLAQLPAIVTAQQIQTQCEAAGLTSDDWHQFFKGFWHNASLVQIALRSHEQVEAAVPLSDISAHIQVLIGYQDQLEGSAAQYDQDAVGFDRAQASRDKLELEAKKWVTEQAAAIRAEATRVTKVNEYETWKGSAGSRAISLKAADVTQKVVTDAYIARFNRELQALGATRIQVELVKTRTRSAKVFHQIRLRGARNEREIVGSVLSEGERRIISLAAFLADVCDKPGVAPFVFDDPISSLDQDFEWSVACRLVELAKTRQVIVLTHRLSLYGILEDVSRKAGDKWKDEHYRPMCIEAYSGAAGHPADQDVWRATTKKANNILLTRLDAAKKAGDSDGAAMYRALAQGICSEFRKLVERSVEDDLLNKVVQRHRRSVTTEGRLGGVPSVTIDDCKLIDSLMTKYSCYEHSQSAEAPAFIPEEPELRADLESLKKWRDDLTARRALPAALA